MSFHPIDRTFRGPGLRAVENSVSCRPIPNYSRTHISISGDLIAHLHLRPGDYIRPLMGANEDLGSFVLERAADGRTGYRLGAQRGARSCFFTVKKTAFLALPDGETARFLIEKQDGRVICRPPQKLPLRAVKA